MPLSKNNYSNIMKTQISNKVLEMRNIWKIGYS